MIDEIQRSERIRMILVAMLFVLAFAMIIARMIQLSLFSSQLYKLELTMRTESQKFKSELLGEIDKFTSQREATEGLLRELNQKLLISQKKELLREIGDLRMKYEKLATEVNNLQERIKGLSALEEKTIMRFLAAYDGTIKKQRKFEFAVNFILGVISSIIASLLYTLAAEHRLVPKVEMRRVFRRIPIIKKLFRNVHPS